MGLLLWREVAAYRRPVPVCRSAVLGAAAGAGVWFGNGLVILSSDGFIGDTTLPWQTNLLGLAALASAIVVMVILASWSACCAWIAFGFVWLHPLRRFVSIGALLGAAVCCISLLPSIQLAFAARDVEWGYGAAVFERVGGDGAWLDTALFSVTNHLALTTPLLIVMWALPLTVATLRSHRPQGTAATAGHSGAVDVLRLALLSGAIGSAAMLAELLVVPQEVSHWWLSRRALAVAIVVLTGCFAAGITRQHPVLAGWAAASICGLGAMPAGMVSALIHRSDITVQHVTYPLWAVTNTGTLAALPIIVISAAVLEAMTGARSWRFRSSGA
jgi:hypothetical protein